MSRFAVASERLDRALQNLEQACEPLAQSKGSLAETEQRAAALFAEREHLRVRVEKLEEQLKALVNLNKEAENRVDVAIDQIRASLGR